MIAYLTTIEDTYRTATRVDGDTNMLDILVVCHQEEFSSFRKYVRRCDILLIVERTWVEPADGIVLVYGCDKRNSFEKLEEEWVTLTAQSKRKDASLIPKILVCNKIDIPIEERYDVI